MMKQKLKDPLKLTDSVMTVKNNNNKKIAVPWDKKH